MPEGLIITFVVAALLLSGAYWRACYEQAQCPDIQIKRDWVVKVEAFFGKKHRFKMGYTSEAKPPLPFDASPEERELRRLEDELGAMPKLSFKARWLAKRRINNHNRKDG